jgi:hypothetical protein
MEKSSALRVLGPGTVLWETLYYLLLTLHLHSEVSGIRRFFNTLGILRVFDTWEGFWS